jgi:phosphohistidine phosphatase
MTSANTLVILRHAKAERPTGGPDHERPLTERGHADAGAAGSWLSAQGYRPDLVICSPARRTRQTWHGVAMTLKQDTAPLVRYEPVVYEGDANEILALLRGIDPAMHTVLLVGHNPTVSTISALLGGSSVDSDGLRTTGLAIHDVPAWSDLRAGTAPAKQTHTARTDE